jgi:hypothetical protein
MIITVGEITDFCRFLVSHIYADQSYGRSPVRAYGLQEAGWITKCSLRIFYNAVNAPGGACGGVAVGRSAGPLLEESSAACGMLAQEAGNV